MSYDATGVRCMMMRAGTSRGLYFLAGDLPGDAVQRDDLLLRLMGTPDPRQIDGLGGATSLTSKAAIVSLSAHPEADVDYLFLQLGVAEPTISDRQNCGNILAGVGPFAVERGLVAPSDGHSRVRIRMVNTGDISVARFPTPGGTPEYRGGAAIDGVPGTAAPLMLDFQRGNAPLLPTGQVRDTVDGIDVTCVDNGMPTVVVSAADLGLRGDESSEQLRARADLLDRVDALRSKAALLMGLGDVAGSSVPKTVAVSAPRAGGHLTTRSFIPVQPHTSIGVLAAISAVTGLLLPGAVGHELTANWPADRMFTDVEHPSGHMLIDVAVDTQTSPPRAGRAGVVRTARKLFDGIAFPRA